MLLIDRLMIRHTRDGDRVVALSRKYDILNGNVEYNFIYS